MEVWKDVIVDKENKSTYQDKYQVSNMGRVKSLGRYKQNHDKLQYVEERIIKERFTVKGYAYVSLYNNGKSSNYFIHRLVALAFLKNEFNFPSINHLDEDIRNNSADNLEWCTHKYNNNYGSHNKKLREVNKDYSKVKVVCLTTNKIFNSIKDGAEYYGLLKSRQCITANCKHKRKSAGKLIDSDGTSSKLVWMYYDEYLLSEN